MSAAIARPEPARSRRTTFVDPSSPVFWVMGALIVVGPADRAARRRHLAQLRYLEAVDTDGPESARAEAVAAAIAPPSSGG